MDNPGVTSLTCTKCHQEKPVAEFSKSPKSKRGFRHYCRLCTAEYTKKYRIDNKSRLRKYFQQRRETNRDAQRLYLKQYYQNNKELFKAHNQEYYLTHREEIERYREANRVSYNRRNMRRSHSLAPLDYDRIYQIQGGKCKICGVHQTELQRRLDIDHDHDCCPGHTSCGKCVRGLLCISCNVRLMHFERHNKTTRDFRTRAEKYLQAAQSALFDRSEKESGSVSDIMPTTTTKVVSV